MTRPDGSAIRSALPALFDPATGKDDVPDHRNAQANLPFIILIVCIATIGGFMFGYDSGVINGTQNGLEAAFELSRAYPISWTRRPAAGAGSCGSASDWRRFNSSSASTAGLTALLYFPLQHELGSHDVGHVRDPVRCQDGPRDARN